MTQKKIVEHKKDEVRQTPWYMTALWGLGLAAWVGGAMFGSQLLVSEIFVHFLPQAWLTSNILYTVYSVVAYALCLLVAIGLPWWALGKKTTRDELGLRGMPTWIDLLLAPVGLIATLIIAMALTAIIAAFMPNIDWQQTQNVGFHGLYQFHEYALAFICLVVLAPICEEVIFFRKDNTVG